MLWNTLNDDTKNIQSVAAFKKEIKTWDGATSVQFVNKSVNYYFLNYEITNCNKYG